MLRLTDAYVSRADLFGANLFGADLFSANLSNANLAEARLCNARLSNARLSSADLRRANLTGADLTDAKLLNANLSGAVLTDATLSGANLFYANLARASLEAAKLQRANLTGADLTDSGLAEADLTDANLSSATLTDSNFKQARLASTILADVNLTSVKDLESVIHDGPSTIGTDTIIRSQGNVPDIFLRGAGVPESFITNMKALISAMDPIQFYSCFISYSTKDQDFADRLHADLQAKGVRCWFAPHDIKGGRKIHEQIDEAIRLYDKLLLILSPHSMASEWVGTEIANADAHLQLYLLTSYREFRMRRLLRRAPSSRCLPLHQSRPVED